MDWSGLPPLNSLRAFAALAQTGSYVQAGTALNVTHAAVSQQIRLLEEWLGVSLVVREGRGIRLTADGLSFARALDSGFMTIRSGVDKLKDSMATQPVQLSTSPAFAMEWLMPRIQDFQSRYPEIPFMLNPTSKLVELKPGGIELAVRYTDTRSLDRQVTAVLVSDMVVIAAPSLLGSRQVCDPAMLMDLPWLQELGTNEVADWFCARGIKLERPLMISQMPGNLIMQAVRRGDGITYTARAFFEDEIEAGDMQVLFSDERSGTYYLVTSPGHPSPNVALFIDWLQQQAAGITSSDSE